jgi:hypothetical protein
MENLGDGRMEELQVTGSQTHKDDEQEFFCSDPMAWPWDLGSWRDQTQLRSVPFQSWSAHIPFSSRLPIKFIPPNRYAR